MDEIDVKLINILSKNAATTATQMVPKVNLSIPAINKRILKLQKSGVIRRFTILVDGEKVGKPIEAFILVVLQQVGTDAKLMEYIRNDPDVMECYAVTGEYDYLIKVCAADVKALEKKLNILKQHKGVAKSQTMFCLQENKYQPTILPDGEGDT